MFAKWTLSLWILVMVMPLTAKPERKEVDGITYHLLRVPAASVRVIWKDNAGKPLRTFPATTKFLESKGEDVQVLMNGGIFEPGGIPSGLLVQDGSTLHPVNRRPGKGNFYLMPNGIFQITAKGASVIRTDEYPLGNAAVTYAVQSGPLLLRKGKVHPAFNAPSTSRLHRNGVGVARNGDVVFAMTDFHSAKFPNLFEFAGLFRQLGCDDALFLDGDISQMRWGDGLKKPGNRFGSFIAVVGEATPDE
ncbi:phosphodiester glycosidase family protein [Haloferula rosea]|uniref:Phosphodiester glycosidase family protein n=1 Tax=Haloferula rosea TaxID=490093 RepID=A0A934V9N0_9BACT|nr:phosphodiester glycosidase family protein [Haloferula rosea]MBK1825408.1 phosphodiester glycosidase family protein [Haloferula rosea]